MTKLTSEVIEQWKTSAQKSRELLADLQSHNYEDADSSQLIATLKSADRLSMCRCDIIIKLCDFILSKQQLED